MYILQKIREVHKEEKSREVQKREITSVTVEREKIQ